MSGELIVFVTSPPAGSQSLARAIVTESLAACVNIVSGVTSVFTWQGEVSTETEDLLVIKTNEGAWDKLVKRVKELHPYDVPEIVCFSMQDGYKPYLDWLNSSVQQRE